ncbi:hypothetical protein DdX_05773 [Ditylenchus destructor]|uniref:ATP-dependent DNA helicase n=1 Tax=Ditylenchus destructor TaxID=166010 RepID=A0AAD4R6X4_9BILA|nr:hypothetical protein DdX_05773 [Ditylenchus destructor]
MIEKANKDTQLTGFMTLCRESIHVDFAKNLYYWQLPEHFSWKDYQWNATKMGTDVLENGKQLAYDKAYAEIAYMYFQEKGQEIMVLLNMPEPNMELNDLLLNLDAVSHAQIAEAMFESMQNNEEQKKFFLMIREEATSSNPRQTCFYLEGQAGTGKTFTYIAIFHDLMKCRLQGTAAQLNSAYAALPTASIPTSMLLDIPSIYVAACDVSSLYTSLQIM